MKRFTGFTLLEVMLVGALITLVLSGSLVLLDQGSTYLQKAHQHAWIHSQISVWEHALLNQSWQSESLSEGEHSQEVQSPHGSTYQLVWEVQSMAATKQVQWQLLQSNQTLHTWNSTLLSTSTP